ncbi:hypothetical protein [Stutzerimonas degradans]|uniref:hypothetical protein n=1 Tax=Stutzerimonas degradans TaxID=2968968 RepID=UPI0021139F73|nr:hypothetical protein [Stutzerimonas degradans]
MESNSGRSLVVIADGVEYSSVGQAATALGLSNSAVLYRLSSPNFPAFHRKGETKSADGYSNQASKAVIVDGLEYSSISQAATALKLSTTAVRMRANDPKYQNYRWVNPRPLPAREKTSQPTVPRVGKVKSFEERQIAKPLIEPAPWPFDGGVQRGQVLDPNFDPPRVIRKIGWLRCMACRRYHFSQDVARVRICSPCGGNGGDKLHSG